MEIELTKNNRPSVKLAQLADLLGLSSRRVQQLADEGRIPRTVGAGRYLLWESVSQYIQFLQSKRGKAAVDLGDGELDLNQERAKLTREQYRAKERENAIIEGQLLEDNEVRLEWSRNLQVLATFLETLPDYIERECGLSPDQAHAVEVACDARRDDLFLRLTDAES